MTSAEINIPQNNSVSLTASIAFPTSLPGHVISVSPNVIMALSLLEGYLQSTYDLQAADTKLEADISSQEAALVQKFENDMNSPTTPTDQTTTYSNWLYLLSQASDQNTISKYAQMYAACNAANQAATKEMDGNNTTAQNTLNQNSQGQQGVVQAMSSINGITANLTRLIQG